MQEHQFAMISHDVQDLVDTIPMHFEMLKRRVCEWQEQIRAASGNGSVADPTAVEADWLSVYQLLASAAEKTANLVRRMDIEGFEIQRKDKLRETLSALRSVTSFSLDRIRASIASLDAGGGVELGGFVASLQSGAIE